VILRYILDVLIYRRKNIHASARIEPKPSALVCHINMVEVLLKERNAREVIVRHRTFGVRIYVIHSRSRVVLEQVDSYSAG
jgi:hypothetical protein